MFFLQLKRHDFEPLLNCQRTKLQNISWEYLAAISSKPFYYNSLMANCKIVFAVVIELFLQFCRNLFLDKGWTGCSCHGWQRNVPAYFHFGRRFFFDYESLFCFALRERLRSFLRKLRSLRKTVIYNYNKFSLYYVYNNLQTYIVKLLLKLFPQ